METLTDDQVAERAQRWAILHKQQKNRDKMDAILDGLSAEDKRRVYLCGQRMVGGLPLKVISAENRKETKHGKTQPGKRPNAASNGAAGNQKSIPLGTAGEPAKGRKSKKNPVDPKQ